MDPNQPMPPSSSEPQPAATGMPPMAGAPQVHRTNNPNDLYAQITAEDEEIVVAPKKKPTPVISLVAIFMKITFWVDEMRRSHERFFIFLHTLWACCMGVLYLAGITTLLLSVLSFTQLPIYLEKYFSEKGIQYDSLEIADYSFSKINVINLRDKNNTYNIPQITVQSTFADFLQNRLRMVEANSLNINISPDINDKGNDLNLIIKLLQAFSDPKKTGLELDVNVIRVNNATLNIQGQKHTIPISFLLSGTYMGTNELVGQFFINEDFLKINASLEITGPEDARKIKIKTNEVGSLTLPQRPTEELQGEINIQMQNNKIQTVEFNVLLNYAYSVKTIYANLNSNNQNTFDGRLSFSTGNSSDGVRISSPTTDVTFDFQGLTLTPDKKLITNQPLQVNLRRLVHQNTIIEGLNTTLNGELSCSIDDASCLYTLNKNTLLSVQNLQFSVKGQTVQFSQNPSFVILPATKENLKLQLNSPYLQLETPLKDVKLDGVFGEKMDYLNLKADEANLQITLAQKPTDTHFKILVKNADYKTSDLSMNHIDMIVDDYFDETGKIQFTAQSVQTISKLLKKPISLEVVNVGSQSALRAQVLNTNLILNAQGYLDPFKSSFAGRFAIPAISLDNLPFTLSELSSVFPKNISHLRGQFAASGQLKINGISSISGPLYVALKNVSFDWDDTAFSGINCVLALKSLIPLLTEDELPNLYRKLFIKNINSFIPLSNLLIQFAISNQSLRLSSVSGQIANQDIIMSSALIPLKSPNVSVPIKSTDHIDLSKLNSYFNLPGIFMENGSGSFNLPVNITENGVNLGDLTIKIINSVWQKNMGQPDDLHLFSPTDTGYMVRSGQLILSSDQQLQVALDGWILPDKEKNSYGPVTIKMKNPLLEPGADEPVPSDIQKLQSNFGM